MDISLMMLSALVTTIGLIIITEVGGRRKAKIVNQFLAYLAIAPILIVLISVIFAMIFNPDASTDIASSAASKIPSMLPGMILSTVIGEFIGGFVWGLYKVLRRLF